MANSDSNSVNSISIQPNQALVDNDFNEDWYKTNLRFIAYSYNRQLPQNGDARTNAVTYQYKTFVEKIMANYAYYAGNQTQTPFAFFNRDETNKVTTTPMFRGMDTKILVDKLVGGLVAPLKKLEEMVGAQSLSPNAVSRKMLVMDLAKLRHENNTYFEIVKQMTGQSFEPIGDFDYSDKEAMDKYFLSFREGLEIAATNIAKSVVSDNRHVPFFLKAALYYTLAGVVMAKAEVNTSGRIQWRLIKPEACIFDVGTEGDDLHINDRFGGEIYQYTIPELAGMNIMTKDELAEAEAIARTATQWGQYNWINSSAQFYWWSTNSIGIPVVSGVKGQWRSLKNVGTEEDPKWEEVLREGILIGNKWIKNFGESKNNVENKTDRSSLKLRYITLTAPSLNGVFYSVVDTLKRYQDLKDALKTKMINMIARSKGKAYMIFSDKLPEGMGTPQMLSQLTQAGFVVVPSTQFDDEDTGRGDTIIQPIDMTMDPSVLSLAQIIQAEGAYMEQIVSYNPVSMGNVTNYISKDQIQASAQGSSSGLAYFTTSFYVFVKNLISYSGDLAIKAMAELDGEYMSVVIGDSMVEVLKMKDVRDASLEDFNISLTIDDFITEQDRMQLMQVALQMASAGQITMADYAKMLSFTSKTELTAYLEMREYKKQKQAEMQRQQELEAAAANADRQAQATEKVSENQSQTKLTETALNHMMAPDDGGGEMQ